MEYTTKKDLLVYIDNIRDQIENSDTHHFEIKIDRGVKHGVTDNGIIKTLWNGTTNIEIEITLQDRKVTKEFLPEDL
jgi:hypothetical protein